MSGLEVIDLTILGPAFCAGILVLATHVPLGREVLSKGIIFIDLAVAQTAGLGVIFAGIFFEDEHGWIVQVSAAIAALSAAVLLNWMERYWPEQQETRIGIVFVLAATGSILLLAGNPHGGEHLKDLLVGQILWVSWEELLPVVLIYAGVLACMRSFQHRLFRFYLPFAVAVTTSVQLLGVYLVFASLILPALATRSMEGRKAIGLALGLGAFGYAAGLIISSLSDLPSGAVIVWCLAGAALGLNAPGILRKVRGA